MGVAASTLLSVDNLSHALSGAVASVVAITVFFPLETIRARKQVEGPDSDADSERRGRRFLLGLLESLIDIYYREGVAGVYKGYSSVITALCCSNFVYFYAYTSLKRLSAPLRGDAGNVGLDAVVDLLCAFVAGIVNVLLTTPLWVANTRLKLQNVYIKGQDKNVDNANVETGDTKNENIPRKSRVRFRGAPAYDPKSVAEETPDFKYRGVFHALSLIRRKEGLAALWAGTLPSILLVLNPAIQWMVYEFLKRHWRRRIQSVGDDAETTKELTGVIILVFSGVAKIISTLTTYPMQVVQTRMRFRGPHQTLFSSMASLWREKGFLGLFRGLESKLAQTVLTAAFMFVVYENLLTYSFRPSSRIKSS